MRLSTSTPAREMGPAQEMGPLGGITVVEMSGVGPGPFAGMMLADLGATVVRVDRLSGAQRGILSVLSEGRADVVSRGRRSIAIDLKSADGVELVLKLVDSADVLIEGYRPRVMERLGLGPDVCLERNPRLVFGRMTGWGQDGPLAQAAGHDINYIALSGALWAIGRRGGTPVPPLNLVGDYGGGGMLLAFGVVAALLSVARTGVGQVVDAAMVDGSALLMAQFYGMSALGRWAEERGTNLLDSGAPFYDVYPCLHGGYLSVGPLEPAFFAILLERLGVPDIHPGGPFVAGWRVSSLRAPARPLRNCSLTSTDASSPSFRYPRRRSIRTTSPEPLSSRATMSSSRRRHRVSRRLRPSSACRHQRSGSTRTQFWLTWGSQ